MRLALLLSAIVILMAGLCAPVEAQTYPWCAIYGKDGGSLNCGFSTREQCLADVSGIGGFCEPNNTYVAATAVSSPHRHARRKPHKNS
jgi:hypothetical protein